MKSVRRPLLLPLVPAYAAVASVNGWMYRSGWLPARDLGEAVISVGSVSAGGAGKTPMVLLLAEALVRRRYDVRILTRGYGRRSAGVDRVNPLGDAAWFGDEPMLMARRSGVPVYVGGDRYQAGMLAQKERGERRIVYLLDDGMQHRKLHRDFDIALLTKRDMEDTLLPAGNLREPISAIERADAIVLREEEVEGLGTWLAERSWGPEAPMIWVIRRRLSFPTALQWERMPAHPLAFSGIARPEGFVTMLEAEGMATAGVVNFEDHHPYTIEDMARLLREAKATGADGFVTTEKDAVKLSEAMRSVLGEIGPVVVAELRAEFVNEQETIAQMIGSIPQMERRTNR